MNQVVASDSKMQLETVGAAFTVAKMLEVRRMTRDAIHEIAAQVKPGVFQEDAIEMARNVLASHDMLRGWHGVCIRFGKNTVKTYGAPFEPAVALSDNDIFFVDIGPVFEEWEGDGGETFTVGADPEKARRAVDARALFHIVRRKWQAEHLTGRELYDFATIEARRLGWDLNLEWSGHRLSDFPHAAVYDGALACVDFSPSPLLWVLEIHSRHPTKGYGAFFEDMLLDDSYFP